MKRRWVGLGVIADNLVNISRAMAKQPRPVSRAFCPQKPDTFVG